MAEEPLGALFERYRREGDLAALARVFEAVGPELLRLARHLRPRGQAPEDLVQSTFLAALTHRERYDARRPLRPWLLGILLNKAGAGRRPELELVVEVPGRESPEGSAQAAESARLLARGLERLPPIYSEVLREHFFAGLPPGAIATRLGRPPGTVRAQLHRGLRLLRGLLSAGLASWLAWLGPSRASLLRVRRVVLEQAAADPASVRVRPGAPPLAVVRIVGAGAVALAGLIGLRAWTAGPPRAIVPEGPVTTVTGEPAPVLGTPNAAASRARAELPATAPAPPVDVGAQGDLLVRVRFPDGSPAAGIGLRMHAWAEPSWRDNRTDGVTDDAGELVLERIHAGEVGLYCDRGGDQGFGATVTAGQRTLREIELPPGVQVDGEVVDARGTPVAHAGIWLSESPLPGAGRIAGSCDELGRFRLRDVSPRRFVGARAEGYAPSEVEWLASGGLREGSSTRLRLQLPDAGGSIDGIVVDAFGAPVPGAAVVVRSPAARAARLRPDGTLLGPSTPLEASADARGRFAFADLALGELELVARADGQPGCVGLARLTAAQPRADVELRLPVAGRLRGTVRFPDGAPAVGAVVIATSAAGHELVDREVDERGEFALEGLAPGTIGLQAGFGHAGGGRLVHATLWLEPGGELAWDALVERPRDYSGRILGPRGEPLAGAWVRAVPREHPSAGATLPQERDALAAWLFDWHDRYLMQQLDQVAADAQGRFTLTGVPRPFAVEVRLPEGRSGWPVHVFEASPASGELMLPSHARHSAGLAGTIAGPDGQALARGEVYAVLRSGGEVRRHLDARGAFRFDALPSGTLDLLVWARGHPPRVVATVELTEGAVRDLGWLQLPPETRSRRIGAESCNARARPRKDTLRYDLLPQTPRTRMKTTPLFLLALALLGRPAAAQTTWYVDAAGVPPGSGTPGDPYTRIQYAIDQPSTVAGDTILVTPGTYVEWLFASKAVRIASVGGPLVTELRSRVPNGTLVFMDGNAKPDLEGFTLAGPTGTLVYQDGGRVIDCILDGRGTTNTGFDMFLGSMVGCTVTGCGIGVRGDKTFDSRLEMYGSVVWGNTTDVFDANFTMGRVVEYSAGLDGDPKWLAFGPGNVIGDPGLWAVDFGDLRLRPGSPCIDAGDPTAPPDPDGSRADIGALPYDAAYVHAPVAYCTPKPASGGCLPAISTSGESSATSPDEFLVEATGIVENTAGILIYSQAPAAVPFQGGLRCIAAPIRRTSLQLSGSGGSTCTGTFALDFNRHVQFAGNPALVPGALVFAQYWYRDAGDPAGFGTGLTDAVRFGVGL